MFTELKRAAREFAEVEMGKYGLPTRAHFDISLDKSVEMAGALGGREDIAYVGACLIDIKLGQAFSENRLPDHVKMGVLETEKLLSSFAICNEDADLIVNCVAAHHGDIPFAGIEAEIVANADCYRFIHPTGVFDYIQTVGKRNLTDSQRVNAVRAKLEEKYEILSLEYAKTELQKYYTYFSEILLEVERNLTVAREFERAS